MKIAIIGTNSTGKTTIIKFLKEKLLDDGFNVQVLPEVVRDCPYPINENTTFQAQKWILEKQIEMENSLNDTNKIIICDRSTLDNFAYFERAVQDRDISYWRQKAVEYAFSYDLIFKTQKLPLRAKDDGFRSTNEEFRTEMDNRIKKIFNQHHVKYIDLKETYDYLIHVKTIKKEIIKLLSKDLSLIPIPRKILPAVKMVLNYTKT